MICGVHGFIGAALGKILQNKKHAFLAGIVSHFFADLLPHRDLSVETESVIALGTITTIAASQGIDSPAFWGAVGAMLPDVENVVSYLGGSDSLLFPTHTGLHGPKVPEILSQIGVVLLCLAVLCHISSDGC